MLRIILTLDYEIHGNGDGCPQELMVEPTYRLLSLCEKYGAKLCIMADVAEILKFKEYKDKYDHDKYCYDGIADQLRYAIQRGHDVQLHIHSSYFNAMHDNESWIQDWSEYNFAGLPYERMNWMVKTCKEFLETLLRPVDPMYRCVAFRAANWSVSPSQNVINALLNNGIRIDTSVFKHGRREGRVNFDYTTAFSPLVPWLVDKNDICMQNDNGELWEFPIYSEKRWVGAFLTPQRIYRAYLSILHKFEDSSDSEPAKQVKSYWSIGFPSWHWLTRKHAWKVDFNQCGGRQLIRALKRAEEKYVVESNEFPFVLIGHSKLFSILNEWSLRPFLAYIAKHSGRFSFGRFSDFPLDQKGKTWGGNC